jgi:hypothetical protein
VDACGHLTKPFFLREFLGKMPVSRERILI